MSKSVTATGVLTMSTTKSSDDNSRVTSTDIRFATTYTTDNENTTRTTLPLDILTTYSTDATSPANPTNDANVSYIMDNTVTLGAEATPRDSTSSEI